VKHSLYTFAIVNLIIWIGNIVYTLIEGEMLFPTFLFDMDLGLLLLFSAFYFSFSNSIIFVFFLLGWTVAGLYAKRVGGKKNTTIILYASLIPAIIAFTIIGIVIVTFMINISIGAILPTLMILVLLFGGIGLSGMFLAIPGYMIANVINFKVAQEPVNQSLPDFLVLFGPTPNEKVKHCPFRMNDQPGCAFLGYTAPNNPLICDYQSKWTYCYVYSHLYDKLEDEFK
jgi:hypothetical protein